MWLPNGFPSLGFSRYLEWQARAQASIRARKKRRFPDEKPAAEWRKEAEKRRKAKRS